MQEQSFEWGGATFTIHQATIGNNLAFHVFNNAVRECRPNAFPIVRYFFAKACAQTTITGNIGWQTPHPGDHSETIAESFDAWQELPSDLGDLWTGSLGVVDAPQTPEELQPDVDTGKLEKKA